MTMFSRVPVLCTRYQAFGVLQMGGVCSICQGAGELPRMIVSLKIIAAGDLDPEPDVCFKRMVVTLAHRAEDGKVVVPGLTDQGMGLVASLPATRFEQISAVEFGDDGRPEPSETRSHQARRRDHTRGRCRGISGVRRTCA